MEKAKQDPAYAIGNTIGFGASELFLVPSVTHFTAKVARLAIDEIKASKYLDMPLKTWEKLSTEQKAKIIHEAPGVALLQETFGTIEKIEEQIIKRGQACVLLEEHCKTTSQLKLLEAVKDPLVSEARMTARIQNICALEQDPNKALEFLKEMKEANAWLSKQPPRLIKAISDKPLKLTIDHIIALDEIKLTRRGLEFSGGHYNGGNFIEKSGLVSYTNVTELGAGTIAADVNIFGKPIRKTYFNPNKSMIDTLKDVYEALESVDINTMEKLKNGTFEAIGKTKEGVIVKFRINPIRGKVNTAFVDKDLMRLKFGK